MVIILKTLKYANAECRRQIGIAQSEAREVAAHVSRQGAGYFGSNQPAVIVKKKIVE